MTQTKCLQVTNCSNTVTALTSHSCSYYYTIHSLHYSLTNNVVGHIAHEILQHMDNGFCHFGIEDNITDNEDENLNAD